MTKDEKRDKGRKLSKELMRLAGDTLAVRFRFFDVALFSLPPEEREGIWTFVTDGRKVYYDPEALLARYLEEEHIPLRAYLHMLLHNLFLHLTQSAGEDLPKERQMYRDLAWDICVERAILSMNIPEASLKRDGEEREELSRIASWIPRLTPDRIYRYFLAAPLSEDTFARYRELFAVDDHDAWRVKRVREELPLTEEDWKKIAERVKTDVSTFSADRIGAEEILDGLTEATARRYDYRKILDKFACLGEELKVSEDEFDYIYYTHGLHLYGKMPLIEPLEYREENKVREFVIVLDTSASTKGEKVERFLRETYEILSGSEVFFSKVKVHIIQVDASVRKDTCILDMDELEEYMRNLKITGFGGTDFRPAFDYVDSLIANKELENLKGLIYFTDGYGVYPDRQPAYETVFVFTEEDVHAPKLPPWASKAVLEDLT